MMSMQAVVDMKDQWYELNSNRALGMLQNGGGSDFVLEVCQEDGQYKEFPVHKYILMVNSDVFLAMFSHDETVECREGRIQIPDSTVTAVHQMLTYMYTGALPKDYDVDRDAGALIGIANKYQIKPLHDFNVQKLTLSLSLENAFDRLKLADFYQINSLKAACGQLIQQKLREHAKWTQLKEECPELAFFVLEECGSRICQFCGSVNVNANANEDRQGNEEDGGVVRNKWNPRLG